MNMLTKLWERWVFIGIDLVIAFLIWHFLGYPSGRELLRQHPDLLLGCVSIMVLIYFIWVQDRKPWKQIGYGRALSRRHFRGVRPEQDVAEASFAAKVEGVRTALGQALAEDGGCMVVIQGPNGIQKTSALFYALKSFDQAKVCLLRDSPGDAIKLPRYEKIQMKMFPGPVILACNDIEKINELSLARVLEELNEVSPKVALVITSRKEGGAARKAEKIESEVNLPSKRTVDCQAIDEDVHFQQPDDGVTPYPLTAAERSVLLTLLVMRQAGGELVEVNVRAWVQAIEGGLPDGYALCWESLARRQMIRGAAKECQITRRGERLVRNDTVLGGEAVGRLLAYLSGAKNVNALTGLAEKFNLEGDLDSAKSAYDAAIRLSPKNDLLPYLRGDMLFARVRENMDQAALQENIVMLDEAIGNFRQAIALRMWAPAQLHFALAWALYYRVQLEMQDNRDSASLPKMVLASRRELRRLQMRRGYRDNALLWLGKLEAEMGNLATAKKHLEKLVHRRKSWFKPVAELGRVARRGGDFAESIRCYERALALKPGHPYTCCDLATVYRLRAEKEANAGNVTAKDQDNRMAMRYLAQAMQADSSNPRAHLNLARIFMSFAAKPEERALQRSATTAALIHLDKALEIFPTFAEAWVTKGVFYATIAYPQHLGRSIKIGYKPERQDRLAAERELAQERLANLDCAIDCFRQAVRVNANHPPGWVRLARTLDEMARLKLEAGLRQHVLRSESASGRLSPEENYAESLAVLRNVPEAHLAKNADAVILFAITYEQSGDLMSARAVYDKYHAVLAGTKSFIVSFLRLLAKQGDFGRFQEVFTQYLEVQPEECNPQDFVAPFGDLTNQFAKSAIEKGELEQAQKVLDFACHHQPDNALVLKTRGLLYAAWGDRSSNTVDAVAHYTQAADDMKRAVDLLQNSPAVQKHLATFYAQLSLLLRPTRREEASRFASLARTGIETLNKEHTRYIEGWFAAGDIYFELGPKHIASEKYLNALRLTEPLPAVRKAQYNEEIKIAQARVRR